MPHFDRVLARSPSAVQYVRAFPFHFHLISAVPESDCHLRLLLLQQIVLEFRLFVHGPQLNESPHEYSGALHHHGHFYHKNPDEADVPDTLQYESHVRLIH